jgi:hypothetical protein
MPRGRAPLQVLLDCAGEFKDSVCQSMRPEGVEEAAIQLGPRLSQ